MGKLTQRHLRRYSTRADFAQQLGSDEISEIIRTKVPPENFGPGFEYKRHLRHRTSPTSGVLIFFVNAMSDLSHPNARSSPFANVFAIIAKTPQRHYQLQTQTSYEAARDLRQAAQWASICATTVGMLAELEIRRLVPSGAG